ncbi:MAG: hydrogenase maturation nickel metallochaperone HypA [Lachnospiraceae bacterium]|nr:hydrogenase maturation nickel metallochaperone HypA [Lachnospiraceae bacterium]
MHELGIVWHVIDMVEKTAEENKVSEVTKVTLEVGEVSTIVPSYFRDCFAWARKKTKYMQNCTLDMVILEGISYCRDCGKTYPTVKYGRTCPYCGSGSTYLVTGSEVTVRDIEVT